MTAKYGVKRRLAILAAALIGATSSSIAAENLTFSSSGVMILASPISVRTPLA